MKVVAYKYMPASPPVHGGLTLWLLLDRWHAPLSTRIICWVILGIFAALQTAGLYFQEQSNPFAKDP